MRKRPAKHGSGEYVPVSALTFKGYQMLKPDADYSPPLTASDLAGMFDSAADNFGDSTPPGQWIEIYRGDVDDSSNKTVLKNWSAYPVEPAGDTSVLRRFNR